MQATHEFEAHSLEAWIAAYDCWQSSTPSTSIIWTGADDCLLKGWDMRVGTDSPLFSKRHGIQHVL